MGRKGGREKGRERERWEKKGKGEGGVGRGRDGEKEALIKPLATESYSASENTGHFRATPGALFYTAIIIVSHSSSPKGRSISISKPTTYLIRLSPGGSTSPRLT